MWWTCGTCAQPLKQIKRNKAAGKVVGVRDVRALISLKKIKRPANVVDVRDVRAALNGLSLSPCKKRCVYPVTNSR